MKVIYREKCPPLTNTAAWALFPYAEYDVVILDSLDSAAEGVGEADSAKPSRAIAPILDIARRENGPAVLILGNTVRTGAHSRGSGVLEDRADMVYEVRDATQLHPSGSKPWLEELPPADAGAWVSRSSRRKQRTKFRLAFVASKFRIGQEPEPFIVETDLTAEPWVVEDVTDEVDREGAEMRATRVREHTEKIGAARTGLAAEILRRDSVGEPPMRKKDAMGFLTRAPYGLKRADARELVDTPSSSWILSEMEGPGHPVGLRAPGKKELGGRNTPITEAAKTLAKSDADFCRPLFMRSAEIPPSEVLVNKERFDTPISAELSTFTPAVEAPFSQPNLFGQNSSEGGFRIDPEGGVVCVSCEGRFETWSAWRAHLSTTRCLFSALDSDNAAEAGSPRQGNAGERDPADGDFLVL